MMLKDLSAVYSWQVKSAGSLVLGDPESLVKAVEMKLSYSWR